MRMKVKNFGPIRDADIVVKPMTILVGVNNLGKSYFAQLYYIILKAFHAYPFRRYILTALDDVTVLSEFLSFVENDAKKLIKQIKAEKLGDREIVDLMIESTISRCSKHMQRLVKMELERGFGVKVGQLVNINARTARVKCDIFRYFNFEFELTKRGQVNIKLIPRKRKISRLTRSHASLLKNARTKRKKKSYVESLVRDLMFEILELAEGLPAMRVDKSRVQPISYYIPAGRGGLIESYDTVLDGLVLRAPLAPMFGVTMPPLPGMAAQFYNCLRRLEGKHGPLSKIVTRPFKELIGGDIKLVGVRIRKRERPIRIKFVYRFRLGKTSSIDLIHAASMIKEVAPIYLITRELVRQEDHLLIEEPESHLHPGAQSKLAEILASLSRNKVNVLLTTHSLTMLRKFSHFVGKKSPKGTPLLDFNSVAIYWLKKGRYGSTTEMLKIAPHGALDEIPTFDEVVNELYDEELELQKASED